MQFSRQRSDAEVLSPKLPETIMKGFAAALPVMALLAELRGETAPVG